MLKGNGAAGKDFWLPREKRLTGKFFIYVLYISTIYHQLRLIQKMISSWKKYWFVLEGQLLLYYRSKDEYEGISPCKGSINLCPPCFIKPCNSEKCVFRIEKKTSSITLVSTNKNMVEFYFLFLLLIIESKKPDGTR